MASVSAPWLGLDRSSAWDFSLGLTFRSLQDFEVPPSLVSYGAVIFALGAASLLLALRSRAIWTRRILGVAVVGAVAAAAATFYIIRSEDILRYTGAGIWLSLAAGLALISGR